MSNSQLAILNQYLQLSSHNGLSHVYRTARKIGLFEVLSQGSGTLESLAAKCQSPERPMQLLLNALCEMGVIQKFADDYILAQVMKLLTTVDEDLGDQSWQLLETCLRPSESSETDPKLTAYRARCNAMQWIDTPAAMELVQLLEIGTTRQNLEILDLGAGTAVWSLAMAHHDPSARVTAVDWPAPLRMARQAADSIGAAARFTELVGDYREVPLPEKHFDLVILANELLLYDDRQGLDLLQRAVQAIKPTGEIAILETVCCHPDASLAFSLRELDLAIHWPRGRFRTPEELEALAQAAGLNTLQYQGLRAPPQLTGLLMAGH